MKAKILHTERLYLKPLTTEHYSNSYLTWVNDPEVNVYLEINGNYTPMALLNFLKEQEEKNIFFWAIHLKNNKHIGNIKVDPIEANSGEYGIMMGDKQEWGKGYAQEATSEIIRFCFEELKLFQITLGVIDKNIPALKLYKKLGFLTYAIKENCGIYNGEKCNSIRMILKNKESSKLILGTVQFGLNYGINNSTGMPNYKNVQGILDKAYKEGVRVLDTAESYGSSQEVIGKYHRSSNKLFNIITKFDANHRPHDSVSQKVLNNITVLGVDSLYGYMYHSFNDFKIYFDRDKTQIQKLKDDGLICKFGVSLYTNQEIEQTICFEEIDIIQVPFNLLDNDNQRGNILKKAKDKGIEVHTRSTFLQGLYFRGIDQLPKKLSPLIPYLKSIFTINKAFNIKMEDLALNYVNTQSYIDHLLIGVETIEQLESNLTSIKTKIKPSVIEKINKLVVKERQLLNPTNWNT